MRSSFCRVCAKARTCKSATQPRGSMLVCPAFERRQLKKEHRKIMEEALGRPLTKAEVVHHINGIHRDNNLDNLLLCSHKEHVRIHRLMRAGRSRHEAVADIIARREFGAVPSINAVPRRRLTEALATRKPTRVGEAS